MKYFLTIYLSFLLSLTVLAQENAALIIHDNYLVGATQNGKWLNDEGDLATVKKAMKFQGFDSFENAKPSEIYGAMDETGCGAHYFYFSKTEKIPESIFEEGGLKPVLALSSNANWNPLPRIPKRIDSTNKIYQKIAIDFLKSKGITTKSTKLENVFSVDLEGDGKDEVFLEATLFKDRDGNLSNPVQAGDHSFILMRKIIDGKPKNYLIKGEFHPKKPRIIDYISEFDLSAVADLNGDGKMEIVLKGVFSYGGDSTEIYESNKNNLNKVLEIECGD